MTYILFPTAICTPYSPSPPPPRGSLPLSSSHHYGAVGGRGRGGGWGEGGRGVPRHLGLWAPVDPELGRLRACLVSWVPWSCSTSNLSEFATQSFLLIFTFKNSDKSLVCSQGLHGSLGRQGKCASWPQATERWVQRSPRTSLGCSQSPGPASMPPSPKPSSALSHPQFRSLQGPEPPQRQSLPREERGCQLRG